MATDLRHLLLAVGSALMELRTGDPETAVSGLAILDPDDQPAGCAGELVLVIGTRGRDAADALRAAARQGAAAVAVKTSPGADDGLDAVAEAAGIVLLAVRPQARWDQLQTVLREVLDSAALAASALRDEPATDLFSLAETVATLTAGAVSIEDTGNRVLAYSRSGDEVDELRRLSILGWQGPEPYLELLRQWGVFQRLRTSEDVVHIEPRPELGIRRRLAIGIRAGTQHLGTIWVQEGDRPVAARAEGALIGAARIAATHLLRQRGVPGVRSRAGLVTGLLDGTASADLVAGQLGLDAAASAVVAVFTTREGEPDHPAHELHRVELGNMVSVHMTSYRPGALVGSVGPRVYAVLPEIRGNRAEPGLVALARDAVHVVRRRSGLAVQAGIGSPVGTLGEVPASRAEADLVLDAMARTPDLDVATITELRAEVLLGETLALLRDRPDLRDPAITALTEHDRVHGTDLVRSLLTYLDAMGDVRAAAAQLHVHPNTLRHRVRRAAQIGDIALDDPRKRLSCHLQLLLTMRGRSP